LLAGNTADLAHFVPLLKQSADGLLIITMDVPAAWKEDKMTLLEYVAMPIAVLNASDASPSSQCIPSWLLPSLMQQITLIHFGPCCWQKKAAA
jgi:hypothetical protein